VPSAQLLAIVGLLTDGEKIVMRIVARVAKSKTNVFSEAVVIRKKACRGIQVSVVLASLANQSLVRRVKHGVWQTTAVGREVAHYLEAKWVEEKYGFPVIRR